MTAPKETLSNGQFKKGNIPWNKGLKGIHLSPTTELKKGQHVSPATEYKKGNIPWIKGQKHSDLAKEKMSHSWFNPSQVPWNKGLDGIHYSPATEFKKGEHISPNTEFTSEQMKSLWTNPEYRNAIRRKMLQGLNRRPTRPEKKLLQIIRNCHLPYEYTGDGKMIIFGFCPDFVNANGQKKLIEIFGRAFHDPQKAYWEIPIYATYEGRKALYKSFGWDCLIIWEDELEDKKIVIKRIEQFTEKREVI